MGRFASAHPDQPGGAHAPRDALTAHSDPFRGQLHPDPGHSIGTPGTGVDGPQTPAQDGVGFGPSRGWAAPPRVVAAGGDTQHPAHRGDVIQGLVRLHEREDLGGTEPVSRANQAAAFERISRSSRSRRFSRRSRNSSSCSSVVRPSARRPSSRSVWRTQLRIAWAEASNSRASSPGVRPARTSSTTRWRYSGGLRWM